MNYKKLLPSTVAFALSLGGLTACSDDDDAPTLVDQTTPGSIANFFATDSRFKVLAEVANQTGLLSTLDTTDGITVFAPTDAAFNALPDEFLVTQNFVSAGDPADITSAISASGLTTLLQAHVVTQNLSSTDVSMGSSFTTLAGNDITVQMFNALVLSGRAQVIEADITLNNGTVHIIDTVFVPTEQLAAAGEIAADAFPGTLFDLLESTPLFRPLLTALQDAGETDALAALAGTDAQTVFLPLNGLDMASDTFFDVHVFPGALTAADLTTAGFAQNSSFAQLTVDSSTTPVTIEGVNIAFTDLAATNGVLHLVEGVLPAPSQSAADLITTDRNFSTLASVLNMVPADGTNTGTGAPTLLDALRGDDDMFTVFAPNNAAFAALATLGFDTDGNADSSFLDEVLADNATLAAVLRYHAVAGQVDPTMTATIATLLGENIIAGTLGDLTVLNGLIEVVGDGTDTSGGSSTVYEIGNALIPAAAGLVRPQVEFPGPTSVALAYFTAFSGFSGAAAATDLPYSAMLEGGGTATFGGTLADIFRFVEDDATLLAPTESANFTGELIAPFAVDTDDDETPDANVTIETTTAFVPLNASLPADASGDVIPYHVAFGTVLSTDLMDGMMVPTLTLNEDGTTGKLDIEVGVGMGVTLNSTTTAVILPDLVTDNGVIHVISEALVPPSGD